MVNEQDAAVWKNLDRTRDRWMKQRGLLMIDPIKTVIRWIGTETKKNVVAAACKLCKAAA